MLFQGIGKLSDLEFAEKIPTAPQLKNATSKAHDDRIVRE